MFCDIGRMTLPLRQYRRPDCGAELNTEVEDKGKHAELHSIIVKFLPGKKGSSDDPADKTMTSEYYNYCQGTVVPEDEFMREVADCGTFQTTVVNKELIVE